MEGWQELILGEHKFEEPSSTLPRSKSAPLSREWQVLEVLEVRPEDEVGQEREEGGERIQLNWKICHWMGVVHICKVGLELNCPGIWRTLGVGGVGKSRQREDLLLATLYTVSAVWGWQSQ